MEREAGPEKVAQFIKEIPDEIVKFDNFTVLEELSNNQIDQNNIKKFFSKSKIQQITLLGNREIEKDIKTVKDL